MALHSRTTSSLLFYAVLALISLLTQLNAIEPAPKKEINFIVYIAGNNNLHKFVSMNINQMMECGSTEHMNILVHLDQFGHRRTTRYYIEKGHARVLDSFETTHQSATGTPKSLYDCVAWAQRDFPSEKTVLVLWNHGAGVLDPHIWGRLLNQDRDELYVFNPKTCLLELDRNSTMRMLDPRGIAFNDTFETYISNQELKEVLEKISHEVLGGKKIDLVGMDACFMAMVEIGSQIKSSVKEVVASQEVEPGPGWYYNTFLSKFTNHCPTIKELASEIAHGYKRAYDNRTTDYTQSAFSLENFETLEQNITQVANDLIELLQTDKGVVIASYIKTLRRSYEHTTAFYNHNYIDLGHLYGSLLQKAPDYKLTPECAKITNKLIQHLKQGLSILGNTIYASVAGPALAKASGLSIYFPTRNIHSSYLKTVFAQTTTWIDFLALFLGRTTRNPIKDSIEHLTHNAPLEK